MEYTNNYLNEFSDNVYQFNEIAGNNTKLSIEDFQSQQRCLIEEVNEISEGLANKDVEEVLDGVIDTLYVVIGMLHKLEEMGINTSEAMKRIAENNLSKFPTYSKELSDKTFEQYNLKGINIRSEIKYVGLPRNEVLVFTDKNSKIRKPYGFKSVTLKDLVTGVHFNE